jgi:hypothetical protein
MMWWQSTAGLAELTAEVRLRIPQAEAAELCGSAALARDGPVADLDFIAFDSSIPPQSEGHVKFEVRGLPAHIVCYHPRLFHSVLQSKTLILAFLRELRKILQGQILFDIGTLTDTRKEIAEFQIPDSLLLPFVRMAESFVPSSPESPAKRLSLYFAIENLTFAWLHSRIEYRYSKPKWLLEDAKYIHEIALVDLLYAVAEDACSRTKPQNLLTLLLRQIETNHIRDDRNTNVCFHTKDAQALISAGQVLESIFPLRMATYEYARWWSVRMGTPLEDIRMISSIVSRLRELAPEDCLCFNKLLNLNDRLPLRLMGLFQNALRAFLKVRPLLANDQSLHS